MSDTQPGAPSESRDTILRDVLVFQVKLWLEGFKDVVLMPLSLGAALVDLIFRRSTKRGTLYSVMELGDRFERWVDLYGALEEKRTDRSTSTTIQRPSSADLATAVEGSRRNDSSPTSEVAPSPSKREQA
jgi:hypothetical protein